MMCSSNKFLLVWIICLKTVGSQYKGHYTSNLHEASKVVPIKVTNKGEHLSWNLTSSHEEKNVHFNVTLHDRQHLLEMQPAKHFMGPAIIIERRGKKSHTRYRPSEKNSNCHFQGFIRGQSASKVALSACNGLVGFIHTSDTKYYIEPVHHSSNTMRPGHKHVVYKRSAVANTHTSHTKKHRRRKRRKLKNCGTREPRKISRLEWQKQVGKVRVQEKRYKHKNKHKIDIPSVKHFDMKKHKYKNIFSRKRRSISKARFVETLLVADASMVEFHQDGDVETYLLTIMNMVSSLYTDPSIGNFVKIVVVKIILIDDSQAEPDLRITSNADFTLNSFCHWQKSLNPKNDSHPHHHDVAVLITRKDICANSNKSCNTLGVAHVGGMCKVNLSCSVNEDNGITLAHTIAHEMGHNLGMYHDTEKIGCKGRHGNMQHIMTPSFQADTVGVSWSRCSRRDITNFLDKGLGECLQDKPQHIEEYDYLELPPGALYDANHQCRLQFGEQATVCSPKDEICFRLWCNVNDTCTTLLIPAAPGTNCGKHKWCQDQKCVPMMDPPKAIDGSWGDWSPWSACSRTCGAGVSISERRCDHPKPASGGAFCVGTRKRYRMCDTEPCPVEKPHFRAVQCSAFNNHSYEGKDYKWLPYFDQNEPCQLYCRDENDTIITSWGEYAKDGTPCNVSSRDVCVSGICKKVSCDWVVDSDSSEDACGICKGDGTKCDIIKGTYTKQAMSPGYREVVVIPAGARNINISEKDFSENYISISSGVNKKFYLNGKRHITLPGEYIIAGAEALYERNPIEKLRIPGPIKEPIVVLILFTGKTTIPTIEYKYSIWKPESSRKVKYSWILSEWSQCSATCGGGIQIRTPLCQETEVSSMQTELQGISTIVDGENCEDFEKLDKIERSCNDDRCSSHWWVGPWQPCPVQCFLENEKPMRRRSVMCVDGLEVALPDKFCDRNTKPTEYDSCETLPSCLEYR